MPYLVKEGDPAPWFTGTTNALGGLADMALRDADAARRERVAIQQTQADQKFRREMDATNFGQQVQLSRLSDQQHNQRMSIADQRRAEEEAAKRAQEQQDAGALQGFLESQKLLPAENPMPDGVAGPGTRPARIGRPADVHAAASLYGQDQARQAAEANRAADNARADASLAEMKRYHDMPKGGQQQMNPDQMLSVAQDLADEYNIPIDEAMRKVRLRNAKALAESQIKPAVATDELSRKQREVESLRKRMEAVPVKTTGMHSKVETPEYAAARKAWQDADTDLQAMYAKRGQKPGPQASIDDQVSGMTDQELLDLMNGRGP